MSDIHNIQIRRLIPIGFLSWLTALGIDFFLHGGLFAGLYSESTAFLLPPEEAFRRIPLGYLSILLLVILILWLMVRLRLDTWKEGAIFGGKLGLLLGSSMFLGLLSISTVAWHFLLGSMFAQIVELAAVGAIIGSGYLPVDSDNYNPISVRGHCADRSMSQYELHNYCGTHRALRRTRYG
jgi:hypothetical protein